MRTYISYVLSVVQYALQLPGASGLVELEEQAKSWTKKDSWEPKTRMDTSCHVPSDVL